MASSPNAPKPLSLTLHQASRVLEIGFDDGRSFRIPFELMRVYSPSAEVMGHGPGQEVLQTGKREVGITEVTPVGHYAMQPRFSDGHESGLFTWEYLYHLGADEAELWARYEKRLAEAGLERDTPMGPRLGTKVVRTKDAPAGGCGHH
ncbi:MAG: DUF971 domain-containing protein [Rubrivivax sp.]|jgi:DUF971 family protein|nr:DUF971 domain-containing protein [Rubrivivax sp.]